ncbi:hypothetical protein [Herbaspirillum huttiense]|uniref:hypothetical protein n=1 Tax=Herbaspirillum huttiense TaxID=863372 RepID=UPI0039B0024F
MNKINGMKFSCRFSLAGAYDEAPARQIGIGLVGAENVRQGAEKISRPQPARSQLRACTKSRIT